MGKRKFDGDLVGKMARGGISHERIADTVGTHQSTISRYLSQLNQAHKTINRGKEQIPTAITQALLQLLALQNTAINTLSREDISTWTTHQKLELLRASTISVGIAHDIVGNVIAIVIVAGMRLSKD